MLKNLRRVSAALALTFGLLSAANAQDFPNRTVRIVVPAAAGGSFDLLARLLAQNLNEKWNQPVIVENRAGGGGNIGAVSVMKSDADGYTLLLWNDSLLINPYLLKDTPFDPRRDFTPLSLSIFVPNVLVANPKSGIKDFDDFLKQARAKPGSLNYASPGNGTPGHLSAELLKQLAGINIVHIPYRGAGPAIGDAVAGQVPLAMVGLAGALSHINAGTLIPLAVTSERRVPALPNVPTISEKGLPNYRVNAWYGIFGPAGMPADVTARIDNEIKAVLKKPEVRQRLSDLGFDPVGGSGSEMATIIERDFPVWRDIVTKSGAIAQ